MKFVYRCFQIQKCYFWEKREKKKNFDEINFCDDFCLKRPHTYEKRIVSCNPCTSLEARPTWFVNYQRQFSGRFVSVLRSRFKICLKVNGKLITGEGKNLWLCRKTQEDVRWWGYLKEPGQIIILHQKTWPCRPWYIGLDICSVIPEIVGTQGGSFPCHPMLGMPSRWKGSKGREFYCLSEVT